MQPGFVTTSLEGLDIDGGFQLLLNEVLRVEPVQGNGSSDVTRACARRIHGAAGRRGRQLQYGAGVEHGRR